MKTKNSKLKTNNCLTDWHCHLLPGVDDGPESLEESLEMARLLSSAGFTQVCCTPHRIKGLYEISAEEVVRQVADLQNELQTAGIELTLLSGMEYYLDEFFLEEAEEWLPLGSSQYILVEFPSQFHPDLAKECIFQVLRRGFKPLLAHPERASLSEASRGNGGGWGIIGNLFGRGRESSKRKLPTILTELSEMGCRLQGNLGSFAGYYGREVKGRADRFLAAGLFSHFGSDAHSSKSLDRNLTVGLRTVRDFSLSPEPECGAEGYAGSSVSG